MATAIYEDVSSGRYHWADSTSATTQALLNSGMWVLFDDTPTTPPPTTDPLGAEMAERVLPGNPFGDALGAASVAAVEAQPTVTPSGAWDFAQSPTVGGAPLGTAHTGAADQVVESSKVTGDTNNRYERRADGSIAIGPGGETPLRSGEAFLVIELGDTDREGIRVYGSSTALNQVQTWFDHLGAPIFSIPVDGGPAVFGDSFRVFGRDDGVFHPRHLLHHDGSVRFNKGDAAGSVGGIAIGAVTTPPDRAPDGTEDGTVEGAVLWVDGDGRVWSRRSSGPVDVVGGSVRGLFPPTAGVQPGDPWLNDGAGSWNFYDGAKWQRVAVDINARRTITGHYTVVNADGYGIVLHSTAAAAVTITLPSDAAANALVTEAPIPWRQYGAGEITFAAGAGATLVSRGSRFRSAGQYAEGTVTKTAANQWLLTGDITA